MSKKRTKVKPDAWMPVFIGDFLAGTSHLSTELRGAYLLLLFAMWKGGARLLNSDEELATITGLGLKRWKAAKMKLMPFFLADDLYLTQKRLSEEYNHAWTVYGKRVQSGKQGGRPQIADLFEGPKDITERLPERGAERVPESPPQSQSQSQSRALPSNYANVKISKAPNSELARDALALTASKALAAVGVDCSNLDAHLLTALDAGIEPAALVALAGTAKGKGKGIAYLSKALLGQRADAAASAATAPPAAPVVSPEKRAIAESIKKIEEAMYADRHYLSVLGSIDKAEFDKRQTANKAALRALQEQAA